jgi:hypothetical protein
MRLTVAKDRDKRNERLSTSEEAQRELLLGFGTQ